MSGSDNSVHVTLGLGLDGPTLTPFTPSVGHLTVGPTGFLTWLEGQLGLERPPAGFTERVMQYLACLRWADHAERFYHASFSVDEIGVARYLLGWRDAWYLAGWYGQGFEESTKRLADMADIEVQAATEVLPSEGQRLQAVLAVLKSVDLSLSVELLDPITAFPPVWQQVLQQLQTYPAPSATEAPARPGSDLHQLQSLLLSGALPEKPLPLKGDGSVLMIEAPSRAVSAEWLAHYYRQALPLLEDDQFGLLCEGDADPLDLAFTQAGVARLSVSDRSPWRPAFQVLPLALELLWKPLNPDRLLEFLTHPAGPLPRRVRRPLADVVAEYPGIAGPEWQAVIEQLLNDENQRQSETAGGTKAGQALQASLDYWLHHERYPEYPGAPLDVVIGRCVRIKEWVLDEIQRLRYRIDMAAERPDDSSDPGTAQAELAIYQQVLNQTNELFTALQSLEAQGETTINADTQRRLVKSVRGQGAERPDIQAERVPGAANLVHARVPAACRGPVEQLIWWGADQASFPKDEGWTLAEREVLAANGVPVQSLSERIQWQADSWLRPVLAARGQLIWVCHEDAGTHHPVFDHIRALVSDPPTESLWHWLQGQPSAHLDSAPTGEPKAARPLPNRTRQWNLSDQVALPKREQESYSSLERFIYGPYLWVLQYLARLRAGAMLSTADSGRLKGNLAHRLFEDFFKAHRDIMQIVPADIEPWSRQQLPELLDTLGANLWLPGRAAERERFFADATEALENLVTHLQSAQVVSVTMESQAQGQFVGGTLVGNLDLLAQRADGAEAVIDLKWGSPKYRREALKNSHYLQLAIYAKLRQAQNHKLPAVGYYMMNRRELLMLDSDFFPKAESIAPANQETLLEFWRRFEISWKLRRAQLDRGQIEVAVSGTDVEAAPQWDEQALPLPEFFEAFNEFEALVGWGEDA